MSPRRLPVGRRAPARSGPLCNWVGSCSGSRSGWWWLTRRWLSSERGFMQRWFLCHGPLACWGNAGQFFAPI